MTKLKTFSKMLSCGIDLVWSASDNRKPLCSDFFGNTTSFHVRSLIEEQLFFAVNMEVL